MDVFVVGKNNYVCAAVLLPLYRFPLREVSVSKYVWKKYRYNHIQQKNIIFTLLWYSHYLICLILRIILLHYCLVRYLMISMKSVNLLHLPTTCVEKRARNYLPGVLNNPLEFNNCDINFAHALFIYLIHFFPTENTVQNFEIPWCG